MNKGVIVSTRILCHKVKFKVRKNGALSRLFVKF